MPANKKMPFKPIEVPTHGQLREEAFPVDFARELATHLRQIDAAYRRHLRDSLAGVYALGLYLQNSHAAWTRFCDAIEWPDHLREKTKPQQDVFRWILRSMIKLGENTEKRIGKYANVCRNLQSLDCKPQDAAERIKKEGGVEALSTLRRHSESSGDGKSARPRKPSIRMQFGPDIVVREVLPKKSVTVTIIGKLTRREGQNEKFDLVISKIARAKDKIS